MTAVEHRDDDGSEGARRVGEALPSHLLRAGYRARVLTRLLDIEAIRADWLKLALASPRRTLFQSPTWGIAVARALEAGGRSDIEPRVIAVHSGSHLVAVLPLCRLHRFGIRVLRQLGEPISQYADVLVAPGHEGALDVVVDAIAAMGDVDAVMLRRIRADGPLAGVLADAGARAVNADVAASVDLTDAGSPESLAKRLAVTGAAEFGSGWKRLTKFARTRGVAHRVVVGAEAEAAARAAINLKRAWLQARGLTSTAFADPLWTDTLVHLAGSIAADVAGMVAIVEAQGQPIGYDLCYVGSGIVYGHVGAFDPAHSDLSPGKIAMAASIGWAVAAGHRTYDFLPPGDAYKLAWTDERMAIADAIWPLTSAGRIVGVTLEAKVKPWLKSRMDTWPEAFRKAAARLA